MFLRLRVLSVLAVLAVGMMTPLFVHAQIPTRTETVTAPSGQREGLVELSVPVGGKNSVSGLPEYIVTLYQYALGIVTLVAIIMVIYGGFQFLLGSTVGSAQKGKTIIADVVGGMVILFLAYVILYNINPKTVNLSLPDIRRVAEVQTAVRCTLNSDCATGQICDQNVNGGTCITAIAGTGTALGGAACAATTDCPGGLRCVNRTCQMAPTSVLCTVAADCGNGQTCSPTSVCCETSSCTAVASTCDAGRACATGTTCFPNKKICQTTVTACVSDANCPARQLCIGRVCQITVTGSSAALDAPQPPAPSTPPGAPATPIAPASVAEFGTCETTAQCQTGLTCAALRSGGGRACLRATP